MPPVCNQHSKLQTTASKIKSCGWRSVNDFVEALYSDPIFAAQSLRNHPDNKSSLSAWLIEVWMNNAPSQESSNELNMTITKAAVKVMVKKSTSACCDEKLHLTASGLFLSYH